MKLHDIIRTYRIKKNLSQKELAELMNMTDRAISNYESGIRTPDFETIKLLRKVLQIPIEELMEVEKMKTNNPFFTKDDFIRFCATWEYRDGGYDLDKDLLKREEDELVYTVFREDPYQFKLVNGNIIWSRNGWYDEPSFVEEFHQLLGELVDKKIYNEPTKFEVVYGQKNYSDNSNESYKKIINGYDNDTETDIFILATVQSVLSDEGSLVECFDFEWKKIA